jgi:aspartokinase
MDSNTLMGQRKTLVMKFGGTSVGSVAAMKGVVEIVRQARLDWPQVVVVTSALAGVTNRLLDSAAEAVQGHTYTAEESAEVFHQMHNDIAKAVV